MSRNVIHVATANTTETEAKIAQNFGAIGRDSSHVKTTAPIASI